jgi:DNA-binding CsgD family transcriptional regulator
MPPSHLLVGIREVHAGKKRIPPEVAAHIAEHLGEESLTARELEVLQQVTGGNRNRDIAGRLFITEETVKVHIKHISVGLAFSWLPSPLPGMSGGTPATLYVIIMTTAVLLTGPGAFSLDARLFGRREVVIPSGRRAV